MEELLYSGVGAVLLAAILVLVCLALLGGRHRRGARSSVAGMMVERSEESVLVVSRPGASYTVSTTSISAPSESSDVPSTAFFTAASSMRGSLSSATGSGTAAAAEGEQSAGRGEDLASAFLHRRISQASLENSKMGALQPELYRKKDQVVRKEAPDAVGKLHARLRYDFSKSDFVVTLIYACDLPSSLSEHQMRVLLKPDLDNKLRQTSSIKKSAPPQEYSFKFPLTLEELQERRLVIQLLDSGRLGRMPMLMGELSLELSELDPTQEVAVTADFQRKAAGDALGELLVSLSYLGSVERLTVTIQRAKELKKMDIAGSSDPYVKVMVGDSEGRLVKKRSTCVKRNTLTPVWDEALSFSVPPRALSAASLHLLVKDHDRLGHNETIGVVEIGPSGPDQRARELWAELMREKNTHATWLPLHPLPQSATAKLL